MIDKPLTVDDLVLDDPWHMLASTSVRNKTRRKRLYAGIGFAKWIVKTISYGTSDQDVKEFTDLESAVQYFNTL